MQSLMQKRVGLVQFEYHSLGVWHQHRLQHIVERMSALNYVCYFSGELGGVLCSNLIC